MDHGISHETISMYNPHWIIANAVELAMFDIRISIGQSTTYVSSIDRLRALYDYDRSPSSIVQRLASEYRHRGVSQQIIEKVLTLLDEDKRNVIDNIDDVALQLAKMYEGKLGEVINDAPSHEQTAFKLYLAGFQNPNEEKLRLLSEEWKVAIFGLMKDARELEDDRNQLSRFIDVGFRVAHVTDIVSARNIVSDAFRVSNEPNGSRESYDTNNYANFYEEDYVGPESEREGCTMHFRWSGAIMDFPPPQPHEMDPRIIYRATQRQCALAPGSEDKLKFTHITLQKVPNAAESQALNEIIARQNTTISVQWR